MRADRPTFVALLTDFVDLGLVVGDTVLVAANSHADGAVALTYMHIHSIQST